MQNYFNYFTEIEERFQQRRGSSLLLSTLDWALIETWREGGVPLEVVLRGIDEAFDKHDEKARSGKGRTRRVNGLAWCAQSVMRVAEQRSEAMVGSAAAGGSETRRGEENGFEAERISRYLEGNANSVAGAHLLAPADAVAAEIAGRLCALAGEVRVQPERSLEDLDRTLTALEDRLFAAILTATGEAELVGLRESAARELAPYRGKMGAVQMKQVQTQFLQKRLLERLGLPRLSLFYMSHG